MIGNRFRKIYLCFIYFIRIVVILIRFYLLFVLVQDFPPVILLFILDFL